MERSAFEQKARTWREKALNVSRHYGAGEDMAEDIAQDVMLRLWQMHDELERFRSVEAIVTLMAKHTLRDLQRRRTAESLEEATIVSLTSSPQEELEAKENEEWLIMKLQQLPTRGMAHNETTATAHHATHLIIYAPRGTAEPRRDCPTIGYRNDISKHAPGKGKTNIIGRNKT